tara:strand:+ start:254 stop:481 length:228 start_codon:yes stop_codon:yes gene_type:complete
VITRKSTRSTTANLNSESEGLAGILLGGLWFWQGRQRKVTGRMSITRMGILGTTSGAICAWSLGRKTEAGNNWRT